MVSLWTFLRIILGIGYQQTGKLHRGISASAGIGLQAGRCSDIYDRPAVTLAIVGKSVSQVGCILGCADRIALHDSTPAHEQKADQPVNGSRSEGTVRGIQSGMRYDAAVLPYQVHGV